MNSTVIDIETKPLEKTELDKFRPVFEEPKTKTAKSALEKSLEWEEKCTLEAHTSQVCAIGIKDEKTLNLIHGKTEKEMLNELWSHLRAYTGNVIGHYIKGFDLPYLFRRSYVSGVTPMVELIEGRYFSKSVIDTMELWAAGEFKASISLDNLSKALGVGEKMDIGKMFYQVYSEDNGKALSYLKNDLNLTWMCANKMGAIK